jgi:succinate-semialdehyde dehydrogenase/glutarate-semialdehyde dehydrogenase
VTVTDERTETLAVLDPATGKEVGRIPAADLDGARRAVAAARAAATPWARTAPAERAAAVKALARRLHEHLDEVARLQTAEGGKPLADSRGGVEAGIATLEQYAELGPLHRGRALQGAHDATDVMLHVPRGVAACMVPWNDPVAILCGLAGANLVVGNPVVVKPSEKTPLHALRVAELADGLFPDGVLQVVPGDGRVGEALVADERVDVVVHVGSVATGRRIAATAAPRMAQVVLELGGKDALVVDDGVDPTWAAAQAALGAFANAGQICTSVERIYCHRAVSEPFTRALAEQARQRVVGDGRDPATEMGPLIDDELRQRVSAHVDEAVEAGARVLAGGHALDRPGSFYAPTVLDDVPDDVRLMTEETFGPVAPVRVVDTFAEALELADGTAYGLAATVLTADMAHAQQAVHELRVGTVKVNAVFGGAPGGAATPHKASGRGFGYGPELLDELTTTRVAHVAPPGR